MQINQTGTDNFCLSEFHQYWENAYWKKTYMIFISIFLNKQEMLQYVTNAPKGPL